MNHQPSPPLIHYPTTTTQILTRTTTIIFSKRHHFLLLSFLFLSFHILVQTMVHSLTSLTDNDPSIKAQFLGDPPPKPTTQLNATTLLLNSINTQSSFISYNGIRVSQLVHSGLKLSVKRFKKKDYEYLTTHDHDDEITRLFLNCIHLATYWFEMFGFIFTQSWINGIVISIIVHHFLNLDHNISLITIFLDGACLGFTRLCGLITIKWVIRYAFTEILGNLFFGTYIEDPYTSYKFFLKLNFMPYSFSLIWTQRHQKEIYGFLAVWLLLEMLVSFVFAVITCIWMADRGKNIREVIREGFRLLTLSNGPAILLKSLEYFLWRSVGAILVESFGELFSSFIQASVEVYFMVVWMIYYFAVKSVDANSRGVRFGRRELQAMLQDD